MLDTENTIMRDTIKTEILAYLTREGPSWGGTVCRDIHNLTGTKESVVERRCRELVNEGRLEKCYAKVNGKGLNCIRLRIKQ